jgi:PIN domain nuclease of toxin-antitoxin system
LKARGRLDLDRKPGEWIARALGDPRVEVFDVNAEIAQAAAELDQKRFPGDPIDRLIYATAREAGADLVTADKRIREFDPQRTIW